ncbi:putative pyridine nucleotide-disulfide oxidoreductase YkgC [Mesotoga infera]|uniref:Putative pyridine nucleotide-disulfide oxidoreductase YkgC n=2 Tax=Mesotoga infera TaxID=1236046 RepID=A0A7Z7PQV6_9BACT|nr:putative pyridine nucleotide-disulfide oxidoreductase YkgC [Mesotoga infera]
MTMVGQRDGDEMKDGRRKFDAIVIGSGQGGTPLALSLAEAGWKVALVERKAVGGTCVNEGCTPTKTMIASARIAHLVRRAGDFGVHAGEISLDLERVVQRKRQVVKSFREGSKKRILDSQNLSLIEGSARFVRERQLEVSLQDGRTEFLEADIIVINTGTSPARPEIRGLYDSVAYDSTSIMELDELPEHLIIVGGGYVGLEFGQMFRRFGSEVTIIQRNKQLLSREDEDIADMVLEIMKDEGIDVLLDSEPLQIRSAGGNRISLTVRSSEKETTLAGSHLLLATGRLPNTPDLNLEKAGIQVDGRGFVRVDSRLETTSKGIYAIGDVKGGPAFTHISYDDFRVLKQNLLNGGSSTIEERFVPYVVFIDPQLGRIGLSEKEASSQGRDFRVAKLPFNRVARAIEMDETRGVMKALVDSKTDQIIGAAILGVEGGEIMSAIQIAMMGGLPYTTLRDGIFAHPTLVESLNNLFMTLDS